MAFALDWGDAELFGICHVDREPNPARGFFATLPEAKEAALACIKTMGVDDKSLEEEIRTCRSVEEMYEHRLFKTRRWLPAKFDLPTKDVDKKFLELGKWLRQNTSSRWWFVAAIFAHPSCKVPFKYRKRFHFPCVEYRDQAKAFVFFSNDNDASFYKLTHL